MNKEMPPCFAGNKEPVPHTGDEDGAVYYTACKYSLSPINGVATVQSWYVAVKGHIGFHSGLDKCLLCCFELGCTEAMKDKGGIDV